MHITTVTSPTGLWRLATNILIPRNVIEKPMPCLFQHINKYDLKPGDWASKVITKVFAARVNVNLLNTNNTRLFILVCSLLVL